MSGLPRVWASGSTRTPPPSFPVQHTRSGGGSVRVRLVGFAWPVSPGRFRRGISSGSLGTGPGPDFPQESWFGRLNALGDQRKRHPSNRGRGSWRRKRGGPPGVWGWIFVRGIPGGPQNPSIVTGIQFTEGLPYENGVEPFSELRRAIEPEGLPYENGVKPFTEVRCRQRLKGFGGPRRPGATHAARPGPSLPRSPGETQNEEESGPGSTQDRGVASAGFCGPLDGDGLPPTRTLFRAIGRE